MDPGNKPQDSVMQDAVMQDGGAAEALVLSEKERRVLELYDRLQELEIEIALVRARSTISPEGSRAVTREDYIHAQTRLLESKALCSLRNEVVQNVMTVNPIIKAVHGAIDASPIERDMLPHIEQRDAASSAIAKTGAELERLNSELAVLQVESMRVNRQNVALASEVLNLAEVARTNGMNSVTDPALQASISKLESDVKAARHKWRIVKGTASAIVAGSGINWAADPDLRDIVLDTD
ncbi:hypothetical protein VTK73DRAFT_366 [Phialemonium thermophilum]|uniref:Centromere protein H C-terminal domain-containing protein n=1 Tax=Phialemonium thermophilum TaxID=223376 RepID=A0ABR3XFH7_9PEZI